MTVEEIANKWVMKRFKTANQPDGHSDLEFFKLLVEDIKQHALAFGNYIEPSLDQWEDLYDDFADKEKKRFTYVLQKLEDGEESGS